MSGSERAQEINLAGLRNQHKVKGLRWWIIALICLGTITNYIDRSSLGVLAPTLTTTWGMTSQEYSYVDASFRIAYTIMQPVCGFILDSVGLKFGFALFGLLWSAFSMACAFATGWASLALFRSMLGAAEASKPFPSGFPRRSARSPSASSTPARRSAACWRRRSSYFSW
jgi:sugar phosphate permease